MPSKYLILGTHHRTGQPVQNAGSELWASRRKTSSLPGTQRARRQPTVLGDGGEVVETEIARGRAPGGRHVGGRGQGDGRDWAAPHGVPDQVVRRERPFTDAGPSAALVLGQDRVGVIDAGHGTGLQQRGVHHGTARAAVEHHVGA